MASVRIENEAFDDRRYGRLATRAGLADADHARGKMIRLWRQCTLEQRHTLPIEDIIDVLGANGVDALVASGLGAIADDGVRIKGTRGRIEWLKKLKSNGRYGKLGGRPKKPKRVSTETQEGFEGETPLSLSLSLSPSSSSSKKKSPPEKTTPPEALDLADQLRAAILAGKPNHAIGEDARWASTRVSWARTLAKTLKRRPAPAIAAAIAHVAASFGDQYAFVVESASSLDEKLDRIEAAMARKASPRPNGSSAPPPLKLFGSSVGKPWPGSNP